MPDEDDSQRFWVVVSAGATSAGEVARFDGNPAAGMLSEIFVQDFTTARVACANCGP